jgi:hypothetical protein
MAELDPSLLSNFWRHGDPWVLRELVTGDGETEQAARVTELYLESVATTLQANLKFVQGLREVVRGGQIPG